MTTITPDIAARYGLAVNQNNGTYKPGVSYGIERKLEVAGAYQRLKDENQGSRPKISDVASECHVSTKMVRKIEAGAGCGLNYCAGCCADCCVDFSSCHAGDFRH